MYVTCLKVHTSCLVNICGRISVTNKQPQVCRRILRERQKCATPPSRAPCRRENIFTGAFLTFLSIVLNYFLRIQELYDFI